MKKYNDIEKWAKIYKDTFVNESSEVDEVLSPAEIMKRGAARKAEYDAEQKRIQDEKNRQTIKEIWVKDFKHVKHQVFADLQIVFMDGKNEQMDFEVTSVQDDKHQKFVARNLRRSRKAQGNKARLTDEDIWIAMIHIAFGDPRIKWFYGDRKVTDAKWAFSDEVEDYENESGYGSERFMEQYLDARMSGSSDPWGDAEIACGIRSASDFYDYYQ